MVVALDSSCISLMSEARTVRSLDRVGSKLRQLGFGLLASGPPAAPASVSEIVPALGLWLGSAAAMSLRHMAPAAVADDLRRTIWPLRSEITVMVLRLSMAGDEGIKEAVTRITDAAGALLERIGEPDREYSKREAEMQAAIGQLRRARDAADAHWWRRKRMRRKIRPGAPPAS